MKRKIEDAAAISEADLAAAHYRKQSIFEENDVYGLRWNTLHEGYFSNPNVSFPLTLAIKRAIKASRPAVVADLGGGTGFVLKELSKFKELSSIRMVNLDTSSVQLSCCDDPRIVQLQASADQFTRSQLQANESGLLVFARSLLHYFDDSELRHLLQHIRNQLQMGEIFVHQSACFEKSEDAECLNLLYKLMKTSKCYHTVNELASILRDAGFAVYDIMPAPKLRLESADLTVRYRLSPQLKIKIRKEMKELYNKRTEVYNSSEENFTAWLHYSIFSCRAI